jgi:hypothetical protein
MNEDRLKIEEKRHLLMKRINDLVIFSKRKISNSFTNVF